MNLMRLFLIGVFLLGIGSGIFVAKNSFLRAWSGSSNFAREFLAVANPNIAGAPPSATEAGSPGSARGSANRKVSKKENRAAHKSSAEVAANTAAQAAVSQLSTVSASVTSDENASAHHAFTKQQTSNAQPLLCSPNGLKTFSRSVLINEVAWAGTASNKTDDEWIELKNNSGSDIALDGWQMQNKNQSIKIIFAASDVIPAGGLYLLERGSDNFLQGIKADKFFTGAIKNNDEALRLFDQNCNVVDEVIANVGADKNRLAGSAGPDYRTAERSSDLSWHSYGGTGANGVFGTPRQENSPASAVSANVAGGASQSQTQSPRFSPPPSPMYYTLQFSKSGTGAGSVTSNPSGISCGSYCIEDSEDFISGTTVSLNAVAADGSEFAGWAGDCSGMGVCSVSMTSAKSVSAAFSKIVAPPPPPPSQTVSSSARSNVNHIVISQVQITGGAGKTTDDFIELYNPSGAQFNLKGYRLVKRAKTSTSDTPIKSWTSDEFIPAYGFYLWANSDYGAIAVAPDATTTASIADDNGIAIRLGPNDTGTIVDSVAWGSAANVFVEGAPYAANSGANQSIVRKSWQDSCVAVSFDASIGNGCDMGNNASDFELSQSAHPRNSQSQ